MLYMTLTNAVALGGALMTWPFDIRLSLSKIISERKHDEVRRASEPT
jgi:hypothetical protein